MSSSEAGSECRAAKPHPVELRDRAKGPVARPTAKRRWGYRGSAKAPPCSMGSRGERSLPWSWGCRGSRNAPLTGDATTTRCAGGIQQGAARPLWQDGVGTTTHILRFAGLRPFGAELPPGARYYCRVMIRFLLRLLRLSMLLCFRSRRVATRQPTDCRCCTAWSRPGCSRR